MKFFLIIPFILQTINAVLILKHDYSILLHIISSLVFIFTLEKKEGKSIDGSANMFGAIVYPFFLLPFCFVFFFVVSFLIFALTNKNG